MLFLIWSCSWVECVGLVLLCLCSGVSVVEFFFVEFDGVEISYEIVYYVLDVDVGGDVFFWVE